MTKLKIVIAALLCLVGIAASAQSKDNNTARPLRFAWGANFTGGVELSEHNMSTIGINGEFGLQYRWIRFVGASAEGNIVIGNSSRVYPISAVFRTDFSNTQKLLFMDLRGGVALLYHEDDSQENTPYASAGLGVTLAHGKTYSSHIIIGYSYVGQETCTFGERLRKCPGISYVTMRLGLAF
jgi:hypothetical protein